MKLSILIPAKNEPYLQKTIDDIFEHSELSLKEVEVFIGLDDYDPEPPLGNYSKRDHNIAVIRYRNNPAGQRAITHELAKNAKGEFLLKVDAHMSFGPGFDRIMLEDMERDIILLPYLMRLDAETWTIKGKQATSRYGFGPDFVQQFLPETDEIKPESMSGMGAAFMISKENYFKWGFEDPEFPSWGGQSVELGIKAFLNGGKVKTTKNTYAAHMFREKPEDFPYDRGENPGKIATELLVSRYKNKSILTLVERFGYPLGWDVELANLK